MIGCVSARRAEISIHAEDVQIGEAKETREGHRADANAATSRDLPVPVQNDPEALFLIIENMPEGNFEAGEVLDELRAARRGDEVFGLLLRSTHERNLVRPGI